MKDVISHNGVFIVSERRERPGILQKYSQEIESMGWLGGEGGRSWIHLFSLIQFYSSLKKKQALFTYEMLSFLN